MAAERVRQAAESVPMRRRDEVDHVLEVAQKWEEYAVQEERAREERKNKPQQKRKAKALPSVKPPPQKRARTKKTLPSPPPPPQQRVRTKKTLPSAPPNTIRLEVPTCTGKVIVYIPKIPGENELQYQLRVSEVSEPIRREADKKELNRMIAAIRSRALCFPPGCALRLQQHLRLQQSHNSHSSFSASSLFA
ncbi:hypothetical protein BT96DRAFT_216166 [Gymnopus androsaceus JB14]|uniref:Uncharacterized protein n=1 Tax=Gymnopus androsaceus JB14 TaxID=1447944 RepID=A0A6A4H748_9AGAR|nr:hypothetical protein BT96DRAFT_216166 [Gymnopus androsaceus JB14]